MRGTKVGDVVEVRPMKGKRLVGTIIEMDPQNNRCVATAEGHVWSVPDAMYPADEPDHTVAVEDIEIGDVVVLWAGAVRTVTGGSRDGAAYTLTLAPVPGHEGWWRTHTRYRGQRLYVIERE